MTLLTNAKNTYESKGLREDLSNVISNISPDECPLYAGAGRASASAVLHEWQTDTNRAAISTNAQLEGDDVTSFDSRAASVRVGNYMQISRVLIATSRTVDRVSKAGRAKELAYQVVKANEELITDLEKNMFENIAGDAGGATTARKTASLGAWLKTNTSKGAAGVDPTYTSGVPSATRTDGTTRAFTEPALKTVISAIFTAGGKMDTLYVHPTNKPIVSAFSGIATRNYDITQPKPTAIIASASVYVGEFGTLKIVPNRFMRLRDAYLIDHSLIDVAFLDPIQLVDLAKTGDAEKRMLICEWGLKVKNEAGLGLVADLNGA